MAKVPNASKEELEEIYRRQNEPIDCGYSFVRRDFFIFKAALAENLKKISKLASSERQHFGASNFSELEDYMEHLQRKVDAALDPEFIITTQTEKKS